MKKVILINEGSGYLNAVDYNILARTLNAVIDSLQGEGETPKQILDKVKNLGNFPHEECGEILREGTSGMISLKAVTCSNPKGQCPIHDRVRCAKCQNFFEPHHNKCVQNGKVYHTGCLPQPVSTGGWEQEFEVLWDRLCVGILDPLNLKIFISKLVAQVREEAEKKGFDKGYETASGERQYE